MRKPTRASENVYYGPDPRDGVLGYDSFRVVINVSDSPCDSFSNEKKHFWFPITEAQEWPYTSLFGAVRTIDHFYQSEPIYVHCHAGVCRAPAVIALWKATRSKLSYYDALQSDALNLEFKRNQITRDVYEILLARFEYPTFSADGLASKVKPDWFRERLRLKITF